MLCDGDVFCTDIGFIRYTVVYVANLYVIICLAFWFFTIQAEKKPTLYVCLRDLGRNFGNWLGSMDVC